MRILIAEDDPVIGLGLSERLRVLGHEPIGPVADGQLAVEAARASLPDLYLFDIEMPRLDGPKRTLPSTAGQLLLASARSTRRDALNVSIASAPSRGIFPLRRRSTAVAPFLEARQSGHCRVLAERRHQCTGCHLTPSPRGLFSDTGVGGFPFAPPVTIATFSLRSSRSANGVTAGDVVIVAI